MSSNFHKIIDKLINLQNLRKWEYKQLLQLELFKNKFEYADVLIGITNSY